MLTKEELEIFKSIAKSLISIKISLYFVLSVLGIIAGALITIGFAI